MSTTPQINRIETLALESANTSLHTQLISEAAKWLQRQGCAVVITDMAHGGGETPDAIGWRHISGGHGAHSILIECKASRSDFLADRHKYFRREPRRGMGVQRYYLAPTGTIKPDELADHWGLLEWTGKKILTKSKPKRGFALGIFENGPHHEINLLLSALRRIGHTAPPGCSVKTYTIESKGRATLGTLPEDQEPDYSI